MVAYRSHGKQGPWSDVYALGGTIYKAITGVTPPESMERLRKDELLPPRTYEASLTDYAENYSDYLCDDGNVYHGYATVDNGMPIYNYKGRVPVRALTYKVADFDDDTGNVLYEGDAIYKYIGYDEMICSSSTRYYEDIVDRIIEEDGVDLYEELAKLDNFTDIRFSKEALR